MGALENVLRDDMPEPVRIDELERTGELRPNESDRSGDYWAQPPAVDSAIPTAEIPKVRIPAAQSSEMEIQHGSLEGSDQQELQRVNFVPELLSPIPDQLDLTDVPNHTVDSGMTADAGLSIDAVLSIDEIQEIVCRQHPALRVASREVSIARAAVMTANGKQNPRFVVDFETPVHNSSDPLELSTRLTFPLGTRRVRSIQYRAAVAEVSRVESQYQVLLEQRLRGSLMAANQVAYWQETVALDLEQERLAIHVTELTQPDKLEIESDEDPARNTIRYINAQLDASRAKEQRFESERSLVVARAELAASMGHLESIRIEVSDDLRSLTQINPLMDNEMLDNDTFAHQRLGEIIARKLSTSAAVAEATAELRRDQHLYQGERERGEDAEMGPTYQDRLGVSDDSAGIRFATDLPLHDNQRGPIAEAAATVRRDQENVRLARSLVINQVNIAYREWQTASQQLHIYQSDDFIEKQQAFLADAEAADVMSGVQLIEIEQAIIRRRREILDLQFRMAELAILLRY